MVAVLILIAIAAALFINEICLKVLSTSITDNQNHYHI
jgi:hypothetical protein